jgi:pimeloyl-ACP methyl ester carboxylesterase
MSGQGASQTLTRPSGRRLGFARYGKADGAPVFYFHGGLSSRLDIAFTDAACRRRGIDLIAIDRPGIGSSDHQPGRRLADWPADVVAVADDLGIDRFAVLGWSGGGPYVLACLAALQPRIAAAAIVAGMAPVTDRARLEELGMLADRLLFPLSRRAPRLAVALLALARLQPAFVIRASLLRSVSRADRDLLARLPASAVTSFFFEALRSGARGTVCDYRLLGGDWNLDWQSIGPVTLWQGEDDVLVPPSHAEALAAALPQARLKLLPKRGHFLLHAEAGRVLGELADALL